MYRYQLMFFYICYILWMGHSAQAAEQNGESYKLQLNGLGYPPMIPGTTPTNPTNGGIPYLYPQNIPSQGAFTGGLTYPTPPQYEPEAQYTMANQNDCSSFYRCRAERCPRGLFWNQNEQRCALDINNECPAIRINDLPTPPTKYTENPSNGQFQIRNDPYLVELCKRKGTEFISHPTDCHLYVVCDSYAVVMQCPADLFWNSQVNACDNRCVRT